MEQNTHTHTHTRVHNVFRDILCCILYIVYTFINTNQALVFFNRQNLSSLSGWARGDESYTFSVINGMCDFLKYMSYIRHEYRNYMVVV